MNIESFSNNKTIENKRAGWEKQLKEVNNLTDGLGLGVDEGIKKTVVAFRICGVNTSGSHEGKLNNYPVPYVDVTALEAEPLYENINGSEEEKDKIREKITKLNLEERKKIKELLEEFYTERNNQSETRLVIQELALGWSRILSQGAILQEKENDKHIIESRINEFKEEMRLFTEFLKNKYLTS